MSRKLFKVQFNVSTLVKVNIETLKLVEHKGNTFVLHSYTHKRKTINIYAYTHMHSHTGTPTQTQTHKHTLRLTFNVLVGAQPVPSIECSLNRLHKKRDNK